MEEVKKKYKNQHGSTNLYLSVYNSIKAGLRPSIISSQLNLKKQRLNYYITSLKQQGFIKKIGYGTWEILKPFDENKYKLSTWVAPHNMDTLKSDLVRGHAFMFTLKIPANLKNWTNRQDILTKQAIRFKPLKYGFVSSGQRLDFKGRKVHLFNNSIIIYEKSSFIALTSKESKKYAIYHLLSFIKALERFLHADFKIDAKYYFKVSRQHYSLIKNALAQQYDKENKKLYCYTSNGLWLVIDNSYNLHELETTNYKTSPDDNKIVQDFFNDLKTHPITISQLYGNITELTNLLKQSTDGQIAQAMVTKLMDENIKWIIKKLGDKE